MGMFSKTDIERYTTGLRTVPDDQLLDFLKLCNERYREGDPIINDPTYDKLWKRGKKLFKKDPFFTNIEEEMKGEVELPIWMHSLDKKYTLKELTNWGKRVLKKSGKEDFEVSVGPKFDGYAAFYDREGSRLYTRGDGYRGSDISHVLSRGLTCEGEGKGEIVVNEVSFNNLLKDKFKDPRTVVGSIIRESEMDEDVERFVYNKHVQFIAFNNAPTTTYLFSELVEKIHEVFDKVSDIPANTDGIVITVTDEDLYEKLGATKKHPIGAVAFKRNKDFAETTVIKIVAQVGRTGRVTPVLEVKPVKLGNIRVTSVNGHNFELLKSKKVGVGSIITITRAGSIGPKLLDAVTEGEQVDVKRCPSCDVKLVKDGKYLICEYTKCKDKSVAQIVHWLKENKVKGIGPSAVNKLVDIGVYSLTDLSKLDTFTLVQNGFGQKEAENVLRKLGRF